MTQAAAVEDPRLLVDRLHEQIAALDEERAALVAAFNAIPRRPPRPVRPARPPVPGGTGQSRDRIRRLAVYSSLRLAGTGKKAAARRIGVGYGTGRQYEADFLAALGGEP